MMSNSIGAYLFPRIFNRIKIYANKLRTIVRFLSTNQRAVHQGNGTLDDIYRHFQGVYLFCPREIKRHRNYFKKAGRGYGEDAFHGAWKKIFEEHEINRALEIGCYRGQVMSLWSLIKRRKNEEIFISGISPLDNSGDSVTSYLELDYKKDIEKNFRFFNLAVPHLLKSYSTDPVAQRHIREGDWDLIYVDGSHDFDIALQDIENSTFGLRIGGILVVDDSSLYKDFTLSFAGHPGPSKVIEEFLPNGLAHLLTVGHNNFFMKVTDTQEVLENR